MANRGYYTALLQAEAVAFISQQNVKDKFTYLNSLYKVADQDGRILSVDKAWDAIHRILSGGWLDYVSGDATLSACVLGGTQLSTRDDWTLSFVVPKLVAGVADCISEIDEAWFRKQYFLLDEMPVEVTKNGRYQRALSAEDFEYTWSYFEAVKAFYRTSATRGLSVVFFADH